MHPHLMNLYIYSVVDACFPIQELDQNWDQNLAENKRHKTIFVSFLLIILRMRNAHNKNNKMFTRNNYPWKYLYQQRCFQRKHTGKISL